MQINLVQISLKCWVIICYIIYRVILVLETHRSINKHRKLSAILFKPHCTGTSWAYLPQNNRTQLHLGFCQWHGTTQRPHWCQVQERPCGHWRKHKFFWPCSCWWSQSHCSCHHLWKSLSRKMFTYCFFNTHGLHAKVTYNIGWFRNGCKLLKTADYFGGEVGVERAAEDIWEGLLGSFPVHVKVLLQSPRVSWVRIAECSNIL